MREKCTPVSAQAAANSMKTSRSATVSMEFCVTCGRPRASTKPSSLRGELAVDRQRGAGDRAGAERTPVGVRRDVREPRAVAFEHLQPRKEVMRENTGWARCRWV
jgi:hypothetical protein